MTQIAIRRLFFAACALFVLMDAPDLVAKQNDPFISGYYKNLFSATQSSGSKEGISSDLQRLRLEFKKQIDPWQFYLTLDNEALLNNFSHTPDFAVIRSKSHDRLASWDLDKVSVDDDHVYLRHSVYRAYIKYYTPHFQAVAGKQTVDWGRMRFYSPFDVFNPVGPVDLEPEERVGVDAVNLNFSPEDFAGINAVVAPGRDAGETSVGLKVYKTITPYDYALIAASVKKTTILGVSFDGAVKDAGFRGEVTQNRQDNKKSYVRISAGVDYNLTEKLYVLWEQFFNGGHDDNDIGTFTSSYRYARETLSIKRNLSSVHLRYSLTPLADLSTTLIYDWEGESIVVNPQLKYNVSPNTDMSVGSQLFWGKADSEFGSYEHLGYFELKCFF